MPRRKKRYSFSLNNYNRDYDDPLIADPHLLTESYSYAGQEEVSDALGKFEKIYQRWKWRYHWIIDNELAIAPMPDNDVDTQRELEKFPTIIALEQPTYTPPSNSRVYVIPVRDFSADKEPFMVALFTLSIVRKPVLVHCKGGCGRSGTLASLYLLYRKIAKTPEEAIDIITEKRGCGPETEAQREIIREFYEVLKEMQ